MDIKGSGIPTEQPDEYRFIKGQGWTTVKAWEGPVRDAIMGKAEEMRIAGFTNIRVFQVEHGRWRTEGFVEGQDGGGEPTDNESWTLESVSEGSDIMNHPLFQEIENDELRKVLDAIQNPNPSQGPALTDPSAITLYTLLLRKVDTWTYDLPVLRRSISPPGVIATGYLAVQKVWDFADLPISDDFPKIQEAAQLASENPPYNTPADHTWGWLKAYPRLTEDVYGRSIFDEEWMLGFWHEDIYPAV